MDKRVKMPAVLGHEMSGEIVAVGSGVEAWKPSDRVTVMPLDFGDNPPPGHSHIAEFMKFMGIDTPGAFDNGSGTAVLLALADGPLYGYAIKDSVAEESGGTLTPRAGTLYRVIARLRTRGFAAESEPDGDVSPNPGLARKYYKLTRNGRSALATEAARLKQAAALAEERLRPAR